ncbi:hypothetical protein ACLBWT_13820 [Paenibacillus sp. D51F]
MPERKNISPDKKMPSEAEQDERVLLLAKQLLLKHRIAFRKLAHRS